MTVPRAPRACSRPNETRGSASSQRSAQSDTQAILLEMELREDDVAVMNQILATKANATGTQRTYKSYIGQWYKWCGQRQGDDGLVTSGVP